MNFAFSPISAGEPPEEPVEFPRQPWTGPAKDVLGISVPSGMVLARTESVAIALTHVTAYPDGCSFALRVAGRRASMEEDAWWDLADAAFGHHRRHRHRDGGLPDAQRRYAVRFADGTTATTVTSFSSRCGPEADPTPPVLTEHGGGGCSGDQFTFEVEEQFWLWPLPQAEVFELIVEWPVAGIAVTIVELDGAPITAAADRAVPYWPEG